MESLIADNEWQFCPAEQSFTPNVANNRFSNWAFWSSSFSSLLGIIIAHPGHASLRSLGVATWGIAARMCRIGCGEPRLETRLDGAAVIFGFFHRPRPVRTIPFRLVLEC